MACAVHYIYVIFVTNWEGNSIVTNRPKCRRQATKLLVTYHNKTQSTKTFISEIQNEHTNGFRFHPSHVKNINILSNDGVRRDAQRFCALFLSFDDFRQCELLLLSALWCVDNITSVRRF